MPKYISDETLGFILECLDGAISNLNWKISRTEDQFLHCSSQQAKNLNECISNDKKEIKKIRKLKCDLLPHTEEFNNDIVVRMSVLTLFKKSYTAYDLNQDYSKLMEEDNDEDEDIEDDKLTAEGMKKLHADLTTHYEDWAKQHFEKYLPNFFAIHSVKLRSFARHLSKSPLQIELMNIEINITEGIKYTFEVFAAFHRSETRVAITAQFTIDEVMSLMEEGEYHELKYLVCDKALEKIMALFPQKFDLETLEKDLGIFL